MALAALALIAYTLTFSEWFVRLFKPQPLMPRYVTGTPWGVRGNIPNARYAHETPDGRFQFHINAQGMRDERTFPLEKPAGTCRIALFGDSFFVGYELNLPDTFATRLEQALQAKGYHVEILNFAVSGFGTAEMLKTYLGHGRNFQPDVVLFQWHSSDYKDNVRSHLYKMQDGRLTTADSAFLPAISLQDRLMRWRLYRLVADHSHLYSIIRERTSGTVLSLTDAVRRFLHMKVDADAPPDADKSSPHLLAFLADPYALELSAALLRQANADVTKDGAGFILVEVPFRRHETNKLVYSTTDLQPPALWNDIKLISPVDAMSAAMNAGAQVYYKDGEGHFSPLGAQMLTDAVIARLEHDPHLARCRQN